MRAWGAKQPRLHSGGGGVGTIGAGALTAAGGGGGGFGRQGFHVTDGTLKGTAGSDPAAKFEAALLLPAARSALFALSVELPSEGGSSKPFGGGFARSKGFAAAFGLKAAGASKSGGTWTPSGLGVAFAATTSKTFGGALGACAAFAAKHLAIAKLVFAALKSAGGGLTQTSNGPPTVGAACFAGGSFVAGFPCVGREAGTGAEHSILQRGRKQEGGWE